VNLKLHPKLKNGYTISILGHIVILILLALYVIKPNLPLKWHSFEWDLPDQPKLSSTIASRGIVPEPVSSIAEEKSVIKAEPEVINPPAVIVTKQPRILESPVIDTPTATSTPATEPIRISRNRTTGALRSLGNTLPSGNLGFSADLEQGDGDAYIISQPKPLIVPDVEGEVLLEFKLTSKGAVDMSSVVVVSYSTASYVEAIQKVLPQWRFGFRGVYNSGRKYSVRCRFVVNED